MGENSMPDADQSRKIEAYDQEVARFQKRNFWCNVLDGNLWDFGSSFIAFGTVIPVFILTLGGNNLTVACIPFLTIICLNLPSALFVHYIEGLDRKKPFVLLTGALLRLAWLVAAIACCLLAKDRPHAMLAILMGCIIVFFAIDGTAMPAWFDLVARTVPVKIRGKMMSFRFCGGSVLGAAGGFITALILSRIAFPLNYGLLFFMAFMLFMISLGTIAFIHEPVFPHKPPEKTMGQVFKALFSTIQSNPNFAWFIVVRAATTIAATSIAFYVVYITKKYGLPASYSGIFTAVIIGSIMVFGPLIGVIADKRGNKASFMISLSAAAIAAGSVLLVHEVNWFYPVLAALGIAQVAVQIADLPMTVEFCPVQDQPLYIATCQVFMAPVALLSLGFGSLADHLGYPTLFVIIGAIALLGLALAAFKLKDPRHHAANGLSAGA
jgi:MFS family permease